MNELLFFSFLIALVLFVWFKTSAFVEYCSLFRFKKLFYIKDFKDKSDKFSDLTYTDYLSIYKDNFLFRLISCPPCLSIWLGGLCYFLHYNAYMIPSSIILGLSTFYTLSILEKKAYE